MIDEQKFKKVADEALTNLSRELIAASDDYGFEVDFNSGALGVEFDEPPAKFVISPNAGPSEFAGKDCNRNYFVMSWLTDTMQGSAGRNATELG